MHGCEKARGSLFVAMDELDRVVAQLLSTAEFSRQVADRYLGPPQAEGALAEKGHDDSNVLARLASMIQRLDKATGIIDYNLNRLSE